nr:hypothetical protein [Tanacetum cinerariifolium]
MAIFIILVSSDSSEESVGTSTGRVILFGTIPTTIPDTTLSMIPPSTHFDTTPIPIVSPTIPPSLDYTPASPDYTPASPDYSLASNTESDPSEDLSSDHIPPLPATSPFLSSTGDSSDSDIPDTPPSPTYVMILAPGQPIPHGRSYRYHLNGSIHMMTVRKRVGQLPTHRLDVRHSVDCSSSDHFSSDDSSRDSSSSSSSNTFSDSSTDILSNFASSHSSSDHSLPAPSSGMRLGHHLCSLVPSIHRSSAVISARPSHDSSSASPSRKRSRSYAASVPLSLPIPRALSYARTDYLPSPKRIRSSKIATDLEVSLEDRFKPYVPRGTDIEMDFDVVRSDGIDIDPEIQVEIDECIAYVDALRHRGIDARVVVEARDQGHRIIATGQQSIDMLERIEELEQDNMILRDMIDVMAISVISVSSDSSEGSVGTPSGCVILLGTILTTIPDTTPVITLPTTQTDTTRLPVIPSRRVMILAPGQPIPHGRPYRYHPNGSIHMMTTRKRVGPLPVQQLAASSDFYSDASFDSSSRHSLSDHSSPDLPSTFAGQSHKRRRVRDSGYLADIEVDPRETSLRDDVIVKGSDEPHLEQDINPEIQAKIDECISYADALRDREDTTKPAQEERAVECTYETLGSLVQRFHGHTVAIPVHRVQ